MTPTSLLLHTETILLAGVSSVLLGFLLLISSRRWRVRHGRHSAYGVLAFLVVGSVVSLGLGMPSAALALGVLASLWVFGWSLRTLTSLSRFRLVTRLLGGHNLQALGLIALGFGSLLGWGAWQAQVVPEWLDSEQEIVADGPPPMRLCDCQTATDLDNPVRLREITDREAATCSLAVQTRYLTTTGLMHQVTRTSDPTFETNCHGWVFTGGRYWLLSEEVQQILDDNGYEIVTTPRAGDLIVYRDSVSNAVLHTGIVSSVTADGKVLIESKWGKMGRFLHHPEDQKYSTTWQFQRSSRPGHLLRNLPGQANEPGGEQVAGKSIL